MIRVETFVNNCDRFTISGKANRMGEFRAHGPKGKTGIYGPRGVNEKPVKLLDSKFGNTLSEVNSGLIKFRNAIKRNIRRP